MPLTIKTSTLKYKDPTTGNYVTVDAVENGEAVTDIQIDGLSIVEDGVADIPVAGVSNAGVVKVLNNYGLDMLNGYLTIKSASASVIKGLSPSTYASYHPVVPNTQHYAAFYGLAKAAGDVTQAVSDNAVGTYTDGAKTAIKTMLGISDPLVTDVQVNGASVVTNGIANVPIAGTTKAKAGAVWASGTFGISILYPDQPAQSTHGALALNMATDRWVREGVGSYAVGPNMVPSAAFYGLAKAANDTTQMAIANSVGTYTTEAKSAISQMLNAPVSVTGTTPSITALAGVRYVCGEVSTLDITLPASGCIDVTFISGATATVLTITPPTGVTVRWANGFDPTSLEANATYEVNICDGLGVAVSWT